MSKIRRLVLDVLKPYDPELNVLTKAAIENIDGIEGINVTVYEMDRLTQKVKIIIEGHDLDYAQIQEILDGQNCVIHSLDQIVAGDRLVEDVEVPQE